MFGMFVIKRLMLLKMYTQCFNNVFGLSRGYSRRRHGSVSQGGLARRAHPGSVKLIAWCRRLYASCCSIVCSRKEGSYILRHDGSASTQTAAHATDLQ